MGAEIKRTAIILDQDDNVATMLQDVSCGDEVRMGIADRIETLVALSDVPYGHKIARQMIRAKSLVKKYGTVIGEATADIPAGEHVHTQNVVSLRGRGDLTG